MIYARMYIGGYISVAPYLEVIWCIPFQLYTRFGCFLVSYFVLCFTLPEDAAPKLVFTTTETPNSRKPIPNLRTIISRRSVTSLVSVPRAPRAQFLLIMRLLALLIIHVANTFFTDRRHMHRFILMPL